MAQDADVDHGQSAGASFPRSSGWELWELRAVITGPVQPRLAALCTHQELCFTKGERKWAANDDLHQNTHLDSDFSE